MPNSIGIVKQISGSVIARDIQGNERILNIGDEVILGETIATLSPDSKAIIVMIDGKELTILGNDELSMNESLIDSGSNSNVLADINDLQKSILEGRDLNELEETAAGGGSIDNAGGTSLGSENFTNSGNISNVFEGYGDLENAQFENQSFMSASGGFSPKQQALEENFNTPTPQEPTPTPQEPTPTPQEPTPTPQEPTPTPQEPTPTPQEPTPTPQEPTPTPQEPTPTPQEPTPTPQEPTPTPQEPTPTPQEPTPTQPTIEVEVEKVVPKLNTNFDSFESKMGLKSKFYYIGPGGDAYTSHANDETKGWTLHSFSNINQALDYASQKNPDATYQARKIDFQSVAGEDLAQNKATELKNSALARFLGNNAYDLKAVEGTDYAIGANEEKGERALNIIEGYAFLQKDKEYKFKSISDDGIRIKIGDKILFNDEEALKGHHDRTMSSIDVYSVQETGFYKLDIAHYDIGWGNATLKLFTIEGEKEIVVGDHSKGGIPLFTDISDLVIVDGQLGKLEGYEVHIGVTTNTDADEVNIKISDKDGNPIATLDPLAVEKDVKGSVVYTLEKAPDNTDVFKAEYSKDEKTISHTTTIIESNAEVIKVSPVKVFGYSADEASSQNTQSQSESEEASSANIDSSDLEESTQNTQIVQSNETINTDTVSNLSEISNSEDSSSASTSLPQGILTQDDSAGSISGIENLSLESGSSTSGDIASANEESTSYSQADQLSSSDVGTVTIPLNTEDTTTSGL